MLSSFKDQWMKNISDIRRKNLELLRSIAEELYNSKNKSGKKYSNVMFADYIGKSASFYSQIRNPKVKPTFSESVARSIEAKVKLSPGWLDIEHENQKYNDVYLDGELVLELVMVFKKFLLLDGIAIDHESKEDNEKLTECIKKAIVDISKFQKISLDDLIIMYLGDNS